MIIILTASVILLVFVDYRYISIYEYHAYFPLCRVFPFLPLVMSARTVIAQDSTEREIWKEEDILSYPDQRKSNGKLLAEFFYTARPFLQQYINHKHYNVYGRGYTHHWTVFADTCIRHVWPVFGHSPLLTCCERDERYAGVAGNGVSIYIFTHGVE